MSGSNRSTQAETQTAHASAQGALLAFPALSETDTVDAPLAPAADPRWQDRGSTCLGPGGGLLWPCALPPFHDGDHLRLSREHVLASVRALRAERDELRSCLLIARPLLADVDMVRGGALRRSLIARIDAAIAR